MLSALKNLWSSKPPVADADAFRDWLSRQASYAAQKSVVSYCEVKAGTNKEQLFKEAEFRAALDVCRWESFAAVLSDLTVLSWMRFAPLAVGHEAALAGSLTTLYRSVLEGQSRPAHRPDGWDDAISAFAARMAEERLQPPRAPSEVARNAAKRIMDTLPIHENHRRTDREAIVGAVQFHTVAAWDALLQEVDADSVVAALLAGIDPAPAASPSA